MPLDSIWEAFAYLIPSRIPNGGQALGTVKSVAPRSIKNQLTDCSGTAAVLEELPLLADQWRVYSEMLCVEKDQINYAYRNLIDAYAVAMRTPVQEMTASSLAFYPQVYYLRFFNHVWGYRWLPQPTVYHLQVEAEIRFRIKGFIRGSTAALARIASKSPTKGLPHDLASRTQNFTAVLAPLAHLEQILKEKIAECPWWHLSCRKAKRIQMLEEFLTLTTRVRHHILVIEELSVNTQVHIQTLTKQVDSFRQLLEGHSFTLPSKKLSAELEPSLDDLLSHNGVWGWALRSRISQACTIGNHGKNGPGDLFSICLIHTMGTIFSDVDDDTLGSFQRSWLIERRAAMDRYMKRTMTDPDSTDDLAVELYEAHLRGARTPEQGKA
ncbi:MAG: hypothetical protein Q9188_005063 [Gyalolechia gomerana]